MSKYLVQVFYTMAGSLVVEADSPEQAIEKAGESDASIHDLEDPSYCDGSWEVGDDPDTVQKLDEPIKYRLWWVSNPPTNKPRLVRTDYDLRALLEIREVLAQHELALGDLIDGNANWIEFWDGEDWMNLEREDEEDHLQNRMGIR